jgi:ATP-dependent 26S proteasome regulatory subunit
MTETRGVFVMAATNRADLLDPALLRGGRLSRTITIPLPPAADRQRLLRLFCAKMTLGPDVDLAALATSTRGLSGADLEALCQQAALRAMIADRNGSRQVDAAAFAAARRDRSGPQPRRDDPDDPDDQNQPNGGYL